MNTFFNKRNRGITLFVAMVTMGTLLLVAVGVVSLAVRQSFISGAARDSQKAFYAADTGIECAIFWDVQSPTGITAFATSTGANINCNGQTRTVGGMGNNATSTFSINFPPDPYCVTVGVFKGSNGVTRIESKGYNTCDASNPRRLERAIRVTY